MITDLSKLGKPGTHFVHYFFLPGTQLTFTRARRSRSPALDGRRRRLVQASPPPAVHQEGRCRRSSRRSRRAATESSVNRCVALPADARPSRLKIRACLRKENKQLGATAGRAGEGAGRGGGANPGRRARRPVKDAARPGRRLNRHPARSQKCLPRAISSFRAHDHDAAQTLQQVLDPPQTDIASSSLHDRRRPLGEPDDGVS